MWSGGGHEEVCSWKCKGKKEHASLCPCLSLIIFIQINFGFCKGDDNFGGRKRKELDDFLKSLGKSMNLVMYRMQDTERVRTKLREDRRQALRTNAEREEEREKMQMERLERNRKWREKKLGTDNLDDIPEEKVLDEKEERRLKNKEWREKRENRGKCEEKTQEKVQEKQLLSKLILPELHCQNCHELLAPPSIILQCEDLHKTCHGCQGGGDNKVRFKYSLNCQQFTFTDLPTLCWEDDGEKHCPGECGGNHL